MSVRALLLVLALALGAAPLRAAAQGATTVDLPTGPITIEAESLQIRKGRVLEASGGVLVTAPGIRARAASLTYDRVTGMVDITGGVTLELIADGDVATLVAASATLDSKTRAGVIRDATLQGAGLTLHGERVSRTESGNFRIDEGRFSPCACPAGKPSWEITATRITARESGVAILQGGVLRAKGIPIFFLPLGFAPFSSDRASGFLSPDFRPGGNDGLIATLPFYVAIAPRWDLVVEPGFNAARGPFVGTTARFANSRGRGEVSVVYHKDDKIKDSAARVPGNPEDYPRDRWFTSARISEHLGRGYQGKARVELAGDDRYNFDFGSSLMERSRSEYETNLFVERRDGILGVVAGSTYYQDLRIVGSAGLTEPTPYNSAQTVSRLGAVDASAAGLPLLGRSGLGIALDLEGQYDFFNNISSPQGSFRRGGELSGTPRRQVQHVRFAPAVTTPISLMNDGVRVVGVLGARGDASSDPFGEDDRLRLAPEVGADARAELRRTFGSATRVQHRVGPLVRWRYVPEVIGGDFGGAAPTSANARTNLTSFESPVDMPVAGNRVEFGISNRLLYRHRAARSFPVRELVELVILERFHPDRPEEGETVANLDLRTGPLRLDLDAVFDNATGSTTSAGGRAATRADAPEGISLDYAYDPRRSSHQGTGGAWLELAELTTGEGRFARAMQTLTVESGARYDFQVDNFLAVSGGIQYESPCNCWGMRIGAAQEADRRVLKLGNLRTPVTDVRFSIDLHPPKGVRRRPEAPGGR